MVSPPTNPVCMMIMQTLLYLQIAYVQEVHLKLLSMLLSHISLHLATSFHYECLHTLHETHLEPTHFTLDRQKRVSHLVAREEADIEMDKQRNLHKAPL